MKILARSLETKWRMIKHYTTQFVRNYDVFDLQKVATFVDDSFQKALKLYKLKAPMTSIIYTLFVWFKKNVLLGWHVRGSKKLWSRKINICNTFSQLSNKEVKVPQNKKFHLPLTFKEATQFQVCKRILKMYWNLTSLSSKPKFIQLWTW